MMRAIFYAEPGKVELRDVPEPQIEEPTDVIVKVEGTTICGSDLHIVAGHMVPESGFVVGHEYVGTIAAVGDAVRLHRVGDRVIGPPAPWCGECDTCRRGFIEGCERGGVLGSGPTMGGWGGTQAEYIRIPWADQDLTRVPDGVSDAQALSLADALPTGWTAVEKGRVAPGDSVLVIGAGPIGLAAVHTAKRLTGAARVIAIDTVPRRLEVAEQLGADATFVSKEGVLDEILAQTGPRGVDVVIDAAGAQATFDLALAAIAPAGRVSIIAIPPKPFTFDVWKTQMKSPTIWTGLGDTSNGDMLMRLIAEGKLDPSPIWTGEIPLAEAPAWYDRLGKGDPEHIKILVRP